VITPAPVASTLTVFIEQASQLVAYRARDGATRWTYTPPERIDTADGFWYTAGLVLGFTYGSDHQTLVAVDAATGHLRWHVRVDGLEPPLIAFASDYVVLELRTLPSPPLIVIRVRDGAQVRDIPVPPWGSIAADGDTWLQVEGLTSLDCVLAIGVADHEFACEEAVSLPGTRGTTLPGVGLALPGGIPRHLAIGLTGVPVSPPASQQPPQPRDTPSRPAAVRCVKIPAQSGGPTSR
jgi:hypothetical protein